MSIQTVTEEPELATREELIAAVEAVLGERVIATEEHINAPAIIIAPDTVAEVLGLLRRSSGSTTSRVSPQRSTRTASRRSTI